MNGEFLILFKQLKESGQSFAQATVINVRGSASARPGSKALISSDGKNLYGWVGGGCAESFVCQQAMEAIGENRTRIVTADLDDEIFGLGMPCGGIMDVYIEPVLPQGLLHLRGFGPTARLVAWLADHLGFRVSVEDERATAADFPKAEFLVNHERNAQKGDLIWSEANASAPASACQAILGLARAVIEARGLSGKSLVEVRSSNSWREKSALHSEQFSIANPEILIFGSSRITEEIALLASLLKWPVTVNSTRASEELYPPGTRLITNDVEFKEMPLAHETLVVIASHHRGDPEFLERAIAAKAAYIALIASPKRANIVFEYFIARDHLPNELARVRAPAGIEMNCQNPAEIALSILSEMLLLNKALT